MENSDPIGWWKRSNEKSKLSSTNMPFVSIPNVFEFLLVLASLKYHLLNSRFSSLLYVSS